MRLLLGGGVVVVAVEGVFNLVEEFRHDSRFCGPISVSQWEFWKEVEDFVIFFNGVVLNGDRFSG